MNQILPKSWHQQPAKKESAHGLSPGAETREPGAKSRRNLGIKITSIRHQQYLKKVTDLVLTPGAEGVGQEPNLAEIWKSRLPA